MSVQHMLSFRARTEWLKKYGYVREELFVSWPGPYHCWERMDAPGQASAYLSGIRSGKSMGAAVAAYGLSGAPRFQCRLCGVIASESEIEEEKRGSPSFVSAKHGLLPLYRTSFGDCEAAQVRRTMRE